METLLGRRQLRWTGHVVRMDRDRLPKQILYGELSSGERSSGGQKKRHKDHIKTILKKFEIPANMLETYSDDRVDWRTRCDEGAAKCEEKIMAKIRTGGWERGSGMDRPKGCKNMVKEARAK